MFKLSGSWAAFWEGCRSLSVAIFFVLFFPLYSIGQDFLPPEQAFKFSARILDTQTIEVTYRIADGYYMYRERFVFSARGATLGAPLLPEGHIKFDETFQKDVETYRGDLVLRLPVEASGKFMLEVTSQGCSDEGLCYAPMMSSATLSLGPQESISENAPNPASLSLTANAEMGRIESALHSRELIIILPMFFLLGIGLSFTPCVLPMIPILSSIIVGEGPKTSRAHSFTLSVSYSLGMALVYTSLGIAAGLAGEGLSATLQQPWMLSVFALLIVVLALSMFGVYQLQVPAAIQARLVKAAEGRSTGKFSGVFLMGAISALIVGPCVAAPLAGTLLYISQTRDVVIGGGALFSMAAGMSVPLLLLGLSAGALLPRAGAWMESVKIFFGVLMLGLAAWIIAPVTPKWVTIWAWTGLGIGYGIYLLMGKQWGKVAKVSGGLFVVFGIVQLVGFATGGRDALEPLAHLTGRAHPVEFQRISSVEELDSALMNNPGKTVMLDFYADWCVSCIEMEKLTFTDARVRNQFADMLLLQADVTANNENDRALLKRFKLFGPPGIIFFDKASEEIPGGRVIGYQNANNFVSTLRHVNSF